MAPSSAQHAYATAVALGDDAYIRPTHFTGGATGMFSVWVPPFSGAKYCQREPSPKNDAYPSYLSYLDCNPAGVHGVLPKRTEP